MMASGAVARAMWRARRGLDWGYPCLIWAMDYVADATGHDPAAAWRHLDWDEAVAKRELARAAVPGQGSSAVERALDATARREGWAEADGARQGAVMLGVFEAEDGIGVPAIFDGQDRWIVSNDGRGVTTLAAMPKRIWEVAA